MAAMLVPAAVAQQSATFVDVEALATADPPARLLFFPLDEQFEHCKGLTTSCPEDSSTVMVVPATEREVVWQTEGGDLRTVPLREPEVRAVGTPPPNVASARYLLPILDGGGIQVRYVVRRFEDGFLVATNEPEAGTTVTPVLAGPELSAGTPSPDVPDRIVKTPRVVGIDDVVDATPVVVVRRAAPSRVLFAIEPAAEWDFNLDYVPLLDDGVIAYVAEVDGTTGLVVGTPSGLRIGKLQNLAGEDPGGGAPALGVLLGAAGVAAVAILAIGLLLRRRRRRT